MHYYNEHDKNAAAWLRQLIADKLIPAGEVDERSIVDVRPADLDGFIQCHFFAGIGGWPRALQIAGIPATRRLWTGSCPCQPFSTAGKGEGTADERHLWPAFKWLIDQCRPPVVFGEQVASKAGREWLDGVRVDLEGLAYEVGGADLCAAGVGAPHIRQRLYWVAYGAGQRWSGGQSSAGPNRRTFIEAGGTNGGLDHSASARLVGQKYNTEGHPRDEARLQVSDAGCPTGGLVLSDSTGRQQGKPASEAAGHGSAAQPAGSADDFWGDGLAHRHHQGSQGRGRPELCERAEQLPARQSRASGFWSDYQLVPCRDGKARRIESGSQPLVDGIPRGMVPVGPVSVQEAQATGEARVARLKGYGNAIVPPLAAEFILAAEEAITSL